MRMKPPKAKEYAALNWTESLESSAVMALGWRMSTSNSFVIAVRGVVRRAGGNRLCIPAMNRFMLSSSKSVVGSFRSTWTDRSAESYALIVAG